MMEKASEELGLDIVDVIFEETDHIVTFETLLNTLMFIAVEARMSQSKFNEYLLFISEAYLTFCEDNSIPERNDHG